MDIAVADQRIFIFKDQYSPKEAEQIANLKKTSAFGTLNKFGSLLSKPSDDDFELVYQEHRFQPFWQVTARASYTYDRTAEYQVKVDNQVVNTVTVHNTDYSIEDNKINLLVTEHCVQNEQDEVYVDAISGKYNPELKHYLTFSPQLVTQDLNTYIPKESILIPPVTRVSAIMRDALAKMIKGVQADTVLEETVKVETIDLYYYPVYAFQYRWKSKSKEGIVEVDGLTGEAGTGHRVFREYIGKLLDKNFLFDVGADAAGMFIPGGSIAVKMAKKYIDSKDL